jgi:hypothetical protein
MSVLAKFALSAWDGRVNSHALAVFGDPRKFVPQHKRVLKLRIADPARFKPVQV